MCRLTRSAARRPLSNSKIAVSWSSFLGRGGPSRVPLYFVGQIWSVFVKCKKWRAKTCYDLRKHQGNIDKQTADNQELKPVHFAHGIILQQVKNGFVLHSITPDKCFPLMHALNT